MDDDTVEVRTTMEPDVVHRVTPRERDGMRAQGYLLEEPEKEKPKPKPEGK